MFLEGEASINSRHRERLAGLRKKILALNVDIGVIRIHEKEEEELARRHDEENRRVKYLPKEEADKIMAMHLAEERKLIEEHEREERSILNSAQPNRMNLALILFMFATIVIVGVTIYFRIPLLN